MFVNISLWLSIGIDNKRIRIEINIFKTFGNLTR